ncbi:hypothetical protein RhiirA5_382069 [Rhizophagus irregularis]|uniref:Uncharacterized protein n=1 Tax=Rhizophagus irregularis TaxID=588596 RepID=A0A2N0P2C5_9GLOM|nr:hypothetical protein RhiirA5_382069 [Rhizophagus irregularis]
MTAKRRTTATKVPAKRGRKRKVLVNKADIVDVDVPSQEPAVASKSSARKRGRKKKEDTVPLNVINIEDVDQNTNEIQENSAINITTDQNQKIKHMETSINDLLETTDDDLSQDENQVSDNDGGNFRRKPLAPITNIRDINILRNNTLDDSNKASESFNIDLHLNNNKNSHPRPNTAPSIDTTSFSPLNITPINNTTRSNINNSSRLKNIPLNTSNDVFRLDISSLRSNSDAFRSNNASFNNSDAFRSNNASFNNSDAFRSNNASFNNSDAFRSNNASSHVASTLPSTFREMDNIHQICSWLCANPNILLFAYNMYLSMQAPVADGYNFISSNFNSSTLPTAPYVPKQDDKAKMGRDFLEELKCLFLRIRIPKKCVYEDLVRQIFNCDLNSTEGIDWLRTANRQFGDFRNKFLDSIEDLINDFKENRASENTNLPLTEGEVISFVNESYTLNILQRWLNATNMTELKAQNSLHTLQKFIRKAFIVNYGLRDTDKTKSLDRMTKDIAVPSRNGKNIASNLQL